MRSATAHKAETRVRDVWWVTEAAHGLEPRRGRLFVREASANSFHSLRKNKGWNTTIEHGRIVWDGDN